MVENSSSFSAYLVLDLLVHLRNVIITYAKYKLQCCSYIRNGRHAQAQAHTLVMFGTMAATFSLFAQWFTHSLFPRVLIMIALFSFKSNGDMCKPAKCVLSNHKSNTHAHFMTVMKTWSSLFPFRKSLFLCCLCVCVLWKRRRERERGRARELSVLHARMYVICSRHSVSFTQIVCQSGR